MKHLYIIRHAQSVHNVMPEGMEPDWPTYHYGLTDLGHQQALAAGADLRALIGDAPVHFFVSDYNRTRQTFKGIARSFATHPEVQLTLTPTLRERERKNGNDPKAMGEQTSFFYRTDRSAIGTGETGANLYDRMASFMQQLELKDSQGLLPENVVLVTHSRAMEALLMYLHGVGHEMYGACPLIPNAAILHFQQVAPGTFESADPAVAPYRAEQTRLRQAFGLPALCSPEMAVA